MAEYVYRVALYLDGEVWKSYSEGLNNWFEADLLSDQIQAEMQDPSREVPTAVAEIQCAVHGWQSSDLGFCSVCLQEEHEEREQEYMQRMEEAYDMGCNACRPGEWCDGCLYEEASHVRY